MSGVGQRKDIKMWAKPGTLVNEIKSKESSDLNSHLSY